MANKRDKRSKMIYRLCERPAGHRLAESEWFYIHDGKLAGPVSAKELQRQIKNGTVHQETRVRRNKSEKWRSAASLFRKAAGTERRRQRFPGSAVKHRGPVAATKKGGKSPRQELGTGLTADTRRLRQKVIDTASKSLVWAVLMLPLVVALGLMLIDVTRPLVTASKAMLFDYVDTFGRMFDDVPVSQYRGYVRNDAPYMDNEKQIASKYVALRLFQELNGIPDSAAHAAIQKWYSTHGGLNNDDWDLEEVKWTLRNHRPFDWDRVEQKDLMELQGDIDRLNRIQLQMGIDRLDRMYYLNR